MLIYVINGPNLNLLGTREPSFYGHRTLQDIESLCLDYFKGTDVSLRFMQSNHEGQLIDWVHEAEGVAQGIVINGAGYSHSSIALLDALRSYSGLVVEVHLSNIHKREEFRHKSYIASRADGIISGCGAFGYLYGCDYIIKQLKMFQKST